MQIEARAQMLFCFSLASSTFKLMLAWLFVIIWSVLCSMYVNQSHLSPAQLQTNFANQSFSKSFVFQFLIYQYDVYTFLWRL